jgi:hypothetical protein
LAGNGIGPVAWQTGYGLVSLVGAQGALPALYRRARQSLDRRSIRCPYQEVTQQRTTMVVPEPEARAALLAIYAELESDLGV